MLSRDQILRLFTKLNSKLKAKGIRGEIGIVGGAVMCVVYQTRVSTKDVDGIFAPTDVLRDLARQLAEEEQLDSGWLNDGAKGYLVPGFRREEVLHLSNLDVWAPQAEYMLAMKSLSARFDSKDKEDIHFLIRHLGMTSAAEVLRTVERYVCDHDIRWRRVRYI